MKKLIAAAILLASTGLTAFAAESTPNTTAELAANSANTPQIRVRIGNGRRQFRRTRIVTRTRFNGRYRETVRTTYYPNGRVVTQVVSRVHYR